MNKNLKPTIISSTLPALILILVTLFYFTTPVLSSSVCSINGYVKDKKTQTPLEKVNVILSAINKAANHFQLETDSNGYFYKTGLQNDVYTVSFAKDGYIPAQTTIRLIIGKQQELQITLEPLEKNENSSSFQLINTAQKLLTQGKYDEAIAKVSEAITTEPANFILYYNRGVAYEKKGDNTNALNDYKKSLELKPDFPLSLTAAGKLTAKNGEFAPAAVYYKKAFTLGITDTIALYNYGACLINLGNNDEAKTVFEKLISLDPNYADAYYQLGIIYLGTGDNARTKELLDKFIALDPQNTNTEVAKEILKSLN